MITEVHSPATGLLAAVAHAAADTLPAGEPLSAGEVRAGLPDAELAQAVLVPFTGGLTGELALLVDDAITDALRETVLGDLDLAAALAPSLAAIAQALGPVVLGTAQVLEARIATARIAGHADAGVVPLSGASTTRAAVALGLAVPAADAPAAPGAGPVGYDRLDLLRGVEMAASAELGRARMTVNDLLGLRNGSVIELDRAAGEAADLFVNGRLIARGEVVVVDENYALRITQIITEDNR